MPRIAPTIAAGERSASFSAGISEAEAIQTLQAIEQVWDHLFPAEQARIAHALIDRIVVRKDGISIEWKSNGMPKLLRDSMTLANLQEAA